jgi:hypothetical protein
LARERADRIAADLAAGADPQAVHREADRLVADALHAIADVSTVGADRWVWLMATQALRVVEMPRRDRLDQIGRISADQQMGETW